MSDPTFPKLDDPVWGDIPWPSWVTSMRPHQERAIVECLTHFANGVDIVMLDAPTGCLAGDTEIVVNRGGAARRLPLSQVVDSFNGGLNRGRQWDLSIPTMIQRLQVAEKWGAVVRSVPLKAAYHSGRKETWLLSTQQGRSIQATADHRFALDGGEMVALSGLKIGDAVLVNNGRSRKGVQHRDWYEVAQGLVNHPLRGEWPYRQPLHRLVVEAHLNGLRLDWYIAILRDKNASVDGLMFLSSLDAVHHRDQNIHHNALDNLEVKPHLDHWREHGLEGAWAHVSLQIGGDIITAIDYAGETETFDLMVEDDPHNFIANEFVVHNSGKSLIGEAVRRLLQIKKALYVCTTKQLQMQFANDYPYGKILMGRSNYPTLDHPELFTDRFMSVSAADCSKSRRVLPACANCITDSKEPVIHCGFCHSWVMCPYEVAKRDALSAPLTITNTFYLLAEANAMGMFSKQRLVIVDECDSLEKILMGHIETHISESRRIDLGIDFPRLKTVEETWLPWCVDEGLPKVQQAIAMVDPERRTLTLEETREWTYLTRLHARLEHLEFELQRGNAVYDGYQRGDITFKPVRVDKEANSILWRHSERFLLMSATIIDPREFVESLGIEEAGLRWAMVSVPSTFPKENRPIVVRNAANMVRGEKEEEWPKMVAAIEKVLAKHPGERTLIHTVSYELSAYLFDKLRRSGRPLVVYGSSTERVEALRIFKETEGAVMLAPSMDRGVDLPEDLCRVVIITKMPFMSLGDAQVKKRMYSRGGQLWYLVQTVRALVQMTGRGVRSAEDRCTCVPPETRILTEDLRWVPAGKLAVGDRIMGFDEKTSRITPRKWRPSIVEATGIDILPRYRMTLANGEELISTPNHRWISKWGQSRTDSWVRTDQLRPGHHLNRYVRPWPDIDTREAGWLAGFFDGEGCLSLNQGSRNRFVTSIQAVQKPGIIWDKTRSILEAMDFSIGLSPQRSSGCEALVIRGGFPEHLRFLGQVRPERLLNKLIAGQFGQRFQSSEYVEVLAIEKIDPGPMVTLQSATETYVAEGYAAHNTYILDAQFQRNVWKKGKNLLPEWWKETLDWSGGGI